jgi:hypothetical protein
MIYETKAPAILDNPSLKQVTTNNDAYATCNWTFQGSEMILKVVVERMTKQHSG